MVFMYILSTKPAESKVIWINMKNGKVSKTFPKHQYLCLLHEKSRSAVLRTGLYRKKRGDIKII